MTTLLAQVIKQLNQFAPSDLIGMYNEYASNNSYETIFDNDDDNINIMLDNPYEAVKSAFYGDYNPSHHYFVFNGYGNLASFNYTTDDNCPIDFDELAEWLINEEKLSEYDIEVITTDDKYNAVLDHINDIDSVSSIQSLLSYLSIDFIYTNEWLEISKNNTVDNYIDNYIDMLTADFIDSKDNEQLDSLIEYFKIDL